MVAGRNASGIASELGSMKVTEQIDAMRALGHRSHPEAGDAAPDRHRGHAAAAHRHRRFRGHVRRLDHRRSVSGALTSRQYWTSVWQALDWNDVAQGLLKPFVFAIVISLVGCYLRPAHHRRHAGRGPLDHPGGGGGRRADLHPGLADHEDLRQPGGQLMAEDARTVRFCGSNTSPSFRRRRRRWRTSRSRRSRANRGSSWARRAAARRCCSRPRWG